MAKKIDRGEILKQVKNGTLTPEEGTALLKGFYRDRKDNYDILYYKTAWKESDLPESVSELKGPVLLFDKNKKLSDALRKALSNRVVLIKGAKKFKKVNDDNFEISLESKVDYKELASICSTEDSAINIIYNRLEERDVEKPIELEGQLSGSLYSMLHLTQALMTAKVKCRVNLIFLHNDKAHFSALSGFSKTLNIENPRYNYHIVTVDEQSRGTMDELISSELLNDNKDYEIKYRAGKRFIKGYDEVEKPSTTTSTVLKEGGVYLLTGGAGGLGLLFAGFLAKNYKARLVLTGRSKLNSERKQKIEKLKEAGAEVIYLPADISKAEDIQKLIKKAKEHFGQIDGVLHCAGLNRDSYIMKKTVKEMEEVLAPKLKGTLLLDEALAGEKLDFFVLFSSIAASLGNAGQADYSYANSFMDYYAAQRKGKTLSINWPLWESGGMQIADEKAKLLERSWGMVPLRSKPGLEALVNGLELETDQLLVVEGDRAKLNEVLGVTGEKESATALEELIKITSRLISIEADSIDPESDWDELGLDTVNQSNLVDKINERYNTDYSLNLLNDYCNIKELAQSLPGISKKSETAASQDSPISIESSELQEKTELYLKEMLSGMIKLPVNRIDSQEPFEKYGIDSILITSLNKELEKEFGELSKTLFFEYQTIEEMAGYFVEEHSEKMSSILKLSDRSEQTTALSNDDLTNKIKHYLLNMISKLIKLPVSRIDSTEALEKYGIDSIMITTLNKELEKDFTNLSKTLFFEYQTIDELIEYFIESHSETLSHLFSSTEKSDSIIKEQRQTERSRFSPIVAQKVAPAQSIRPKEPAQSEDIAIIGVSGRYPMAENLDEYWQNLIDGRDCITEIPAERWDHSRYFNPDKNSIGTTYGKWGGFIKDIDKFDPLFFNIAPREAELMDPHMRVFLETAWKTVEDAGYTVKGLRDENVGVFAGQMFNYYMLYGADKSVKEKPYVEPASLSNRVSYHLNFNGPSITVDTMCSSSLTTIHLACQSINNGDCSMAIAGGVNVTDHPNKYLRLAQQNFLASDGRCKSFGIGGDGYVPGEGVGALLLKPLNKAINDKDHIYAVIKSTSVNHGGKVNGYTVPNPNAQAKLIEKALERSGVDIKTINYIETHGTGTSLGDPIEITGLSKAFKKKTKDKQFCSIGSVKSNIGHLESAAGVAAVTKVLLQMKYKKLVPSIHSKKLNPNINFQETPFFVQRKLENWQKVDDAPRRAGVSSFGAGGANAHLILEEYSTEEYVDSTVSDEPQVIPFSAANKKSLDGYIKEMIDFLKNRKKQNSLPAVTDIAYNLQFCREAMIERLAVVVSSVEELQSTLEKYIDEGPKKIENLENRNIKSRRRKSDFFIEEEEGDEFIKVVVNKRNYIKLAQMWVHGIEIDWTLLNKGVEKKKISLPTYSFLKKRCWLDAASSEGSLISGVAPAASLHPLVGGNISTVYEQCFTTRLTGNEFFINDHLVGNDKVLPGVSYLEMARAAGTIAFEQEVTSIKNIIWARPLIVGEMSVDSFISLYPSEPEAEYEIWSLDEEGERVLNSQGKIGFENKKSVATLEIEQVKGRCSVNKNAEQCYSIFKKMNLNYGPGFKGIKELSFNENEALALLEIPAHLQSESSKFMLPPTIMDGALQAVVGLLVGESDEANSTFLPFALGEVVIHTEVSDRCYAYVTTVDGSKMKFDIAICSETGEVLVSLKGFAVREFRRRDNKKLYYYTSEWQNTPLITGISGFVATTLIFDFDETLSAPLSQKAETILIKPGKAFKRLGKNSYVIAPEKMESYDKLIKELIKDNHSPTNIIHCWSQRKPETILNSLSEQLDYGVYSLFNLTKALMSNKVKGKIKLLYLYNSMGETPASSGMSGFVKTVNQENAKYSYKAVGLDTERRADYIDLFMTELTTDDENRDLQYRDGERFYKRFIETIPPAVVASNSLLKTGGVYLITGGTGGLGLVFAKYLAEKVKAKLILTGRSQLNDKKREEIAKIEAFGSKVTYIQSDITSKDDVNNLLVKIKDHFGHLNGIIHSAGLLRDSFIIKKSFEDFKAVAGPKVWGTAYLDEITKDEPLDFFMLFSSISGSTGNPGQCDYSYSNCFMDDFATAREVMRKAGKRSGKTVSINWPLWEEGGMNVTDKTREYLRKTAGMIPLRTAYGLEAFEKALLNDNNHVVVVEGDKPVIDKKMNVERIESVVPQISVVGNSENKVEKTDFFHEKIESYLKRLLSKIIKMEPEDIKSNESFEKYGIDSIMITTLNAELEKDFKDLSKTIFFEYQTINELTQYFLEEHSAALSELFTTESKQKEENATVKHKTEQKQYARFAAKREASSLKAPHNYSEIKDIAIIGISGRYPMAENLDELWKNLMAGKDCITEIPKDRWDHERYFKEGKKSLGTTYSKWGGFINDIDKFDPLFFNISPREAELMDPHARLFLQTAWKTIENGGYTLEKLQNKKVGVFTGQMFNLYSLYGADESVKRKPNVEPASIANRVSYHLNLKGPSMAVDTMCSTSLSTIHLACQSIKTGDCEMAIAGGVNISDHPNKYIKLSEQNFLSSDGKCKSFGIGGDGYVPGEGVGAVLLKPLEQAIKDQDHIYAIIKSTSVNHGGKVNSYTVPNPNAQADLIEHALEKSKVDVNTINYIEAHGTGTPLGDPIEITGLTKAFNKFTNKKQFCSIGSIKSNIGHLESAAGIAAISKVLLQMKYKKLVPSIHSEQINPNISFGKTPFYVQKSLDDWNSVGDAPLRAGISSFGAGGSNAHVILEEYKGKEPSSRETNSSEQQLLVFSTRNKESLNENIKSMLTFIAKGKEENSLPSLADIAYTLQSCREEMDERLAVVASSINELEKSLENYIKYGPEKIDNLKTGTTGLGASVEEKKGNEPIEHLIDKKNYMKIAQMWVDDTVLIDWNLLNRGISSHKVPLPTYSFSKKRCWIDMGDKKSSTSNIVRDSLYLHPLVGQNVSTLYEQRFTTKLKAEAFFIKDHIVGNDKLMPGVGYLEMARAAGSLAAEMKVTLIKKIVWSRPLKVNKEPVDSYISFLPGDGDARYEIWSPGENGERVLNSKGAIDFKKSIDENTLEIEEIRKRCPKSKSREECYNIFKGMQLNYGPAFQGITALSYNRDEALARLEIPPSLHDNAEIFKLHPTIMDGSLQSVIGLVLGDKDEESSTFLPFSLDEVEIIAPTERVCYAYIKTLNEGKSRFNISITDTDGKVLVQLKGFSIREFKGEQKSEKTKVFKRDKKLKELLINLKAGKVTAKEVDKILGGDNEL